MRSALKPGSVQGRRPLPTFTVDESVRVTETASKADRSGNRIGFNFYVHRHFLVA